MAVWIFLSVEEDGAGTAAGAIGGKDVAVNAGAASAGGGAAGAVAIGATAPDPRALVGEAIGAVFGGC